MTHARTLPRYACLAGLVAGLLAPVHALASPSAEIRSVQSAGSHTPTHINTTVRAAYRFSANDPRFYHRLTLAVSRQNIRTGALAALSRGVMHPGLQLAIVAAGFVWSQHDQQIMTMSEHNSSDVASFHDVYSEDSYGYNIQHSGVGGYPFTSPYAAAMAANAHYCGITSFASGCFNKGGFYNMTPDGYPQKYHMGYKHDDGRDMNVHLTISRGVPTDHLTINPDGMYSPASESDLEELDAYFPGTIIDDLWADDPAAIPQPWQDAISVLPFPNLNPAGQAAPEVHQGVSRWAENMTARMQDEALPYPDPGVSPEGNTAAEEIVDRMDEEPPDFPNEPEPVWNVVEIDELPDYNASIGSGQCPGPHHINFPFFGSISLNWQPACDLASNIRGAVIALGYILGLLIVVGRK